MASITSRWDTSTAIMRVTRGALIKVQVWMVVWIAAQHEETQGVWILTILADSSGMTAGEDVVNTQQRSVETSEQFGTFSGQRLSAGKVVGMTE
mmetsp:Transcript_92684/g.183969  ORF Transcript_92684/g.183969 Transcript_92684/m.183969 type:complete len:94 (-) Transcript_92684:178-459(-)